MASHAHGPIDLNEKFEYTNKKPALTGMVAGLVIFILGVILLASGIGGGHHDAAHQGTATEQVAAHPGEGKSEAELTHKDAAHADGHAAEGHADAAHAEGHGDAAHGEDHGGGWLVRVWANLWLNGVFFFGIALVGVFFVAVNYAAWAGWSAGLIRVPMAFGAYLPIGLGVLIVTFLLGHHDLFHWTHDYLYDPNSPHFDKILDGKKGFLNVPFYLIRMVAFGAIWYLLWRTINGLSAKEDSEGGTKIHDKIIVYSAIFIITFAVGTSIVAWDWVMSIDPHWYSTLFGWYTFASWWVSGLSIITLTVIYLKEQGYLKIINENHIHDLGKFMFAFSVFWTYLWFAQFMLIYYANIPEEIVYFDARMNSWDSLYKFGFFLTLVLNFLIPLLFLMTRASKRKMIMLKIAAYVILAGHYLDFYHMIMPGTVKGDGGIGLVEIGSLVFFTSLFIYVVSNTLSKQNLIAKNHPMLEESIHHDV